MIFNGQKINHQQVNQGLADYKHCLVVYNNMNLSSRSKLLAAHGHHKAYASRTFSYLFKNIREDLKRDLLAIKLTDATKAGRSAQIQTAYSYKGK